MTNKLPTLFWVIITLLFTTTACGSSKEQDFHVGEISTENVLAEQGFAKSYQSFSLNDDELAQVQSWGSDVRIDVFFGMWCHDSEREVPRLLKLLEQNQQVKLNMYALDLQKSDEQGLAKKYRVKYTPTIIVYAGEKEVGRIIERPEQTLVADINQMLAN